MSGQKSMSILIDEESYKLWKDTGTKAKIIFEEGLKYRKIVEINVQLRTLLEDIEKRHQEETNRHLKAHEHMVSFLNEAEKSRNITIKQNNELKEENLRLQDKIKQLTPRVSDVISPN